MAQSVSNFPKDADHMSGIQYSSRPVLGVTGPIGAGKSSVLNILKDLGARTIDSDQVVHNMYLNGTDMCKSVMDAFGDSVAGPDGIDRKALSDIVFNDPSSMEKLESIVHPAVTEEVQRILSMPGNEPAAVLEAIKLVQSKNINLVLEVWIVTADSTAIISRLKSSRRYEIPEIRRRLDSQLDATGIAQYLDSTNPTIRYRFVENNLTKFDLRNSVFRYWQEFLQI